LKVNLIGVFSTLVVFPPGVVMLTVGSEITSGGGTLSVAKF